MTRKGMGRRLLSDHPIRNLRDKPPEDCQIYMTKEKIEKWLKEK